jgi:N-formylglutamate amidohydrolase
MNLMMSTLLATDMILDVIEGQIILHIPHSKTKIPFYDGFNMDYIENETKLLVDHDTDKIFDIPNVESLVFECNRIFCDVERLDDEDEPLFEVGRGFYYTKTDDGKDLRILNNEVKNKIKTDFYDKHHNKLIDMVEDRLNEFGSALIIDCHSFNDVPLNSDLDKTEDRPDISLGVDYFHTPEWLINKLKLSFENNNFSVKINSPYSGTIIPLKYYNKDKRVMGIMIEVNKKLYLVDEDKIIGLNHIIRKSLFS